MIKCFYPNKDGKIVFTKKELENLLDEVYKQGYNDAPRYTSYPYWWYSPITTTPYYTTCDASDISSITLKNDDPISYTTVHGTVGNSDKSYTTLNTIVGDSLNGQTDSYTIKIPNNTSISINTANS